MFQSYCHTVSRLAFLTFSALMTSGCAINDFGLVKVRHFENETTHMVSKESWGAYLSTSSADGGLMFGHMKRILLYPKTMGTTEFHTELPLERTITTSQQDKLVETENDGQDSFDSRSPIASITNNQGLIFNANQLRIGCALGLESRDVIRLPNDFEGIFVFNYSSSEKIHAYFRQQSTNIKH